MGKQVVKKNPVVAAIIDNTDTWISGINKSCNAQIKTVLVKQGQFIDGYNKVVDQITKFNENPNASLLIKGENPIYIAPLDTGANKRPVSLEFNKNRELSSFDLIPLSLNVGLSAVFKDMTPDEFNIIIKKELRYEGDYYVDAPAVRIEYKEPQDVPILKLLDQIFLYIGNYPNDADRFDSMINGCGVGESSKIDISMYLQDILEDYDVDLKSIAYSVEDKELYIRLNNYDFSGILDVFKVPNENYFNDFNTALYKGFE